MLGAASELRGERICKLWTAYATTGNQIAGAVGVDLNQRPQCTTTHGGQIFSVLLFLSRKALFLRAIAFCLVDATGQISLVFVLREQISLFFLTWLVDVSMS